MSVLNGDVDLSALGFYNVKSSPFNALGDGVHDDTAAIQSAINAAYTAGGGVVYLPSGSYLINGGPIQKGNAVGDPTNALCYGTATIPAGITWAPNSNVANPAGYCGPNYPLYLHTLFHGTLPNNMMPNGPLLLLDNVVLMGNGPEQTILLAGEQIYNGWIFNPTGQLYPPVTGSLVPLPQLGAVISTWNNWGSWPLPVLSGNNPNFTQIDGFAAHNCFIRDLTVDCQAHLADNAGKPLHIYNSTTFADVPNSPPYNTGPSQVIYAVGGAGTTPVGQLYGVAVSLQYAEGCGIENVWVRNANVNGINITGTQNLDAHANGPVPVSYQQLTAPNSVNPLGLDEYVLPATPQNLSNTNVPIVNGYITNCRVDLNYPYWIAGTRTMQGHGNTGGSDGGLPIRIIGCAAVEVSGNRIGILNKPSNFGAFPPPSGYTNYPDVPPNTDDALDCPGSWHIVIKNNIATSCGDGVGSEGNGSMVIANNVFYNFGSNGVDAPSSVGKTCSQTVITGNVFFLSSDSGTAQMAINITDVSPSSTSDPYASGGNFGAGNSSEQASSQQGDILITDNVFYAPGNDIVINLLAWGAIVKGNIFDFAGGGVTAAVVPFNHTPYQNPVDNPPGGGTKGWPAPFCTGIVVKGNGIIIEGNIFRNAALAGTINGNVIGISFPSTFPPKYVPGDVTAVIVRGNIFDKTIGVPIQDNSHGSDGLLGVRIIDNIGINPAGVLSVALVPIPGTNVPFINPYPYDCYVGVTAGTSTAVVALYGVTFSSVASGQQKSFVVKAGGAITLTYTGAVSPSWVWVGM
jgi:hypothetical protein